MRNFSIPVTILLLCNNLFATAQYAVDQLDWKPKTFIENQGQVTDQNGKSNDQVKFLYNDGFFNLALKPSGFSYEIFEVTNEDFVFDESAGKVDGEDEVNLKVRSQRIDVSFEGANRDVQLISAQKIEAYFNFIYAPVETNSFLKVPGFQKMIYKNLYDGIDLVFLAPDENNETSLRYEFVVHPGADPSQIKFRYEGANDFALNEEGSFLLNASFGFVEETQPKFLVEGKAGMIEGAFSLKKNIKSFLTPEYDRSKFMIIDPNIIWGSYYGGEGPDEIVEIVVSSTDKPTIDGNTLSFNHIASAGAHQMTYGGGQYDFFIGSFKANGKLNWSTYFGGSEKEDCYGLGMDNNDNIIAVGNTKSNGLATAGAYKTSVTAGGKADIVIAKFNKDGSLTWCTYYGGEGGENPRNCVSDSKGRLYLAGTTGSATGIAYGNAAQPVWGGTDDTWIAKFTKEGWPVWSTYYGGTGVDRAHAINLDGKGNLFVGGTANSTSAIATPGAFHTTYAGGTADAFLAKYDTAGNFIWGTYIGGKLEDRTRGVECDSTGNVYIAGFTFSDTGIATQGSYHSEITPPPNGGSPTQDAFLMKFTTGGTRLWGTYYGGANDEQNWGSTIDKKTHSIFIMGSTSSPTFINNGNYMQEVKAGGEDGYLAKFNESGTIQWSTYWGGRTGDQFEDAMPGHDSYLYVAGRNTSSTMPVTRGVYQKTFYGGPSDAMVYKFYVGNDCLDQYEPNESTGSSYLLKAVSITDSTNWGWNGSIASPADADWYKLKVQAGALNYRMILQDLHHNYDLKFYNSTGGLIHQSLHTDLIPDTITANNLVAATYYIEVSHNSGVFDPQTCYRLRLYNSASPIQKESLHEEYIMPEEILIYPNPADNEITVNITSAEEVTGAVIVYDLAGRTVYEAGITLSEGKQFFTIPVRDLSPGPHQLVIMNGKRSWVGKFIKQ